MVETLSMAFRVFKVWLLECLKYSQWVSENLKAL